MSGFQKRICFRRQISQPAGAAPTEDYMKLMIESFRSYIGCFRAGGNEEGGYVFGLSTNAPGDVTGTGAMEKAYRLGFELIGNR